MSEAIDEIRAYGVRVRRHDWERASRLPGHIASSGRCKQQLHARCGELGPDLSQVIQVSLAMTVLDNEILTVDPAKVMQLLDEGIVRGTRYVGIQRQISD